MEKYDIIECFRDGRSTSDKYVCLELFKNGKPKKILGLYYWLTDEAHNDKYREIDLHSSDNYAWQVVDKVDPSERLSPYRKVCLKIKSMDRRRKEQGYAF